MVIQINYLTSDRFSSALIISHLKLDGITNLQVFNVAAKLRKVEEKTRLAFTALDKPVRMQQLLDDARLTSPLGFLSVMLSIRIVVVAVVVVGTRRVRLV